MKIKVAFVSKKMDMGGIEKIALSILKVLNAEEFQVDYFYRRRSHENVGELFTQIPNWINKREIIIPNKHNYKDFCYSMRQKIDFWGNYIQSFFSQSKDVSTQYSLQSKYSMAPKDQYDLAIAFDGPKSFGVFYTIEKVKAKVKVLWIHGDVAREMAIGNLMSKYYNSYDYIFTVSEEAKKILLEKFNELDGKVRVVYNYVDFNRIRKSADIILSTPFDGFNGIKITTVGRLGNDKGMIMAVECCKLLLSHGINVKWVLCGDGPERCKIEEYITKNRLEKNFFLVGNQSNPYPFIKACDIYVQPSIQEGFCTTTIEAKVLRRPVVTTEVCGMREQFQDGVNGIIVKVDTNSIFEGIMKLIREDKTRQRIILELGKDNYQEQVDYNRLFHELL